MSRWRRRLWVWLAILVSGASLFQTVGFTDLNGAYQGGCRPFAANGITSAVDMCYLFDCENGFFGGLIDPCDPAKPAFLDCGNYVPPDDEDTTATVGG